MRSTTIAGAVVFMLMGCSYDRGNGVSYPAGGAASVTVSLASADPMTSAGDTQVVTAVVKAETRW